MDEKNYATLFQCQQHHMTCKKRLWLYILCILCYFVIYFNCLLPAYICSVLALLKSWQYLSSGGGNLSSEPPFIQVLPAAFTFDVSCGQNQRRTKEVRCRGTEGGWAVLGRIQREQPDVSEPSLLALTCCPTSEFNASAQSKTGCCWIVEINKRKLAPCTLESLTFHTTPFADIHFKLTSCILKVFVKDSRRLSYCYQMLNFMQNPET